MQRKLLYIGAGLLTALLAAGSTGAGEKTGKPATGAVCNGDFGTSVKFLATPTAAAKQALKEQKLVLVLHVSGDFEDPDFT